MKMAFDVVKPWLLRQSKRGSTLSLETHIKCLDLMLSDLKTASSPQASHLLYVNNQIKSDSRSDFMGVECSYQRLYSNAHGSKVAACIVYLSRIVWRLSSKYLSDLMYIKKSLALPSHCKFYKKPTHFSVCTFKITIILFTSCYNIQLLKTIPKSLLYTQPVSMHFFIFWFSRHCVSN